MSEITGGQTVCEEPHCHQICYWPRLELEDRGYSRRSGPHLVGLVDTGGEREKHS